MKKNFFKKLSFVMALAMIVSVVAPAASAFAAATPKINATSKTLALGETKSYDFSVVNKVKGSTYTWTSDNKKVATVDSKNGLTKAVAVGTAKITVKVKAGKKTYTSSAKVTVKDNIKTLTITNKPANDTLAVDAENDFNRSYKTFGGKTTGTTSKTYWTVEKDGAATTDATISSQGVFKATAAGEYTITANAKDGSKVKATDTYKVTVKASLKSVVQKDTDTIVATFDSNMSKTDLSATTAKLFVIIGDKQVSTGAEKIKTVTLDSTGKVATIDLFASLSTEAKYDFVYGEMKGSFTAAKKDLSLVKTIQFSDFTVGNNTPEKMSKHVLGLNADGVAIYDGNSDAVFANFLSFTYGGEATKGYAYGDSVCLYAAGNTADVSAKFSYGYYDSTAKTYNTNTAEDSAVVTAFAAGSIDVSTLQFELTPNRSTVAIKDSEWKGNLKLAVKDEGYSIQARYKIANSTDTAYKYSWNDAKFSYVSSDTSKLTINKVTNGEWQLVASVAGTVTVVVKDADGKAITSFDVTVVDKRSFATATVDTPEVTVDNTNPAVSAPTKVSFSTLDNLGSGINAGTVTSTVAILSDFATDTSLWLVKPTLASGTVICPTVNTDGTVKSDDKSYNKNVISINGAGATPGFYMLKVTLQYVDITGAKTNKDVTVSINVVDGSDTAAVRWNAEATTSKVDLNANYGQKIGFTVYGFNVKGARVAKLDPTADYNIKVVVNGTLLSDVDPLKAKLVSTASSEIIAVDNATTTAVANVSEGTYTFTFTAKADNLAKNLKKDQYLGSFSIVVTDSTKKSLDNTKYIAANDEALISAVSKALTFNINEFKSGDEDEINTSDSTLGIQKIVYYDGNIKKEATTLDFATLKLKAGQSILITEVDYVTSNGATPAVKLNYVFNPNITIEVQ